MRTLLALSATLALSAGCTIEPVSLEGRVCTTNVDCIANYICSSDRICIPLPDSGRIDAGRDAFTIDVARDAFRPFDGGPDTGLPDAFLEVDAPDAFAPDAAADPDAFSAPDAFTAPDAFVEADAFMGLDAHVAPDAHVEPDAFVEADAP